MTHKERNHIYFEEQCWVLTMSRASSFLGVFPSFCRRFAFPRSPGLSPGGGGRPAPAPVPAATPLVHLPRFSGLEQTELSWRSRARPSGQPRGRVGVSAWGAISGDVHRGTMHAGGATPSGPTNPSGHGSAHRGGTHRRPESMRCWERALGKRGRVRRAQSTAREGPATALPHPPALPHTTQRHLLLRPNHLVAEAASLTSDPRYTQPNHFLAHSPFPSWVIQRSWSSFPTRQQHQLQLLISSGCHLGWSQVRGSC